MGNVICVYNTKHLKIIIHKVIHIFIIILYSLLPIIFIMCITRTLFILSYTREITQTMLLQNRPIFNKRGNSVGIFTLVFFKPREVNLVLIQ